MASRMIFSPIFRVLALSVATFLLPLNAQASSPASTHEITSEIINTANREADVMRLVVEDVGKKINSDIELVIQTLVEQEKNQSVRGMKSDPLDEIITTFTALPLSNLAVDQIAQDVMFNRQRELNRIKIEGRADYLIDTSLPASVDSQAFDIFMRYFCDPKARGGSNADFKVTRVGVPYGDQVLNYELGCGYTNNGSVPTRHSILGGAEADAGHEAAQVIGLPTRPDALFFEATTFPTKQEGQQNNDVSNTNRLAQVYYAAFSQSLLFLLGEPPSGAGGGSIAGSPGAYIANQAAVAKKMLASYPFALLFAERMGTMGPDAAQATADLLLSKLGSASEDINILNVVQNIERRNTISQAEYMDIVMYQLPLSPGYYSRINDQLTSEELRREAVWLTAMQTALNYQRNRWLEILAALEAVK